MDCINLAENLSLPKYQTVTGRVVMRKLRIAILFCILTICCVFSAPAQTANENLPTVWTLNPDNGGFESKMKVSIRNLF